jgi:Family of unknown function (DUF6011)
MTNNSNDFDDDLSDLLGRPMRPASEMKQPPASYVQKEHLETCTKCHGTGRFTSWSGRTIGNCFACKGAGRKSFKTSSADRAKAREQAYQRKATNEAERVVSFQNEWPLVWAWINAQTNFEFAVSMRNAVAKYGFLTEKQMAACQRMIDKELARKAEREARVAAAPAVDTAGIDRLKAAFDKAAAYTAAKAKGLTVRNPKITLYGVTISPAKANSANPGALYVKSGETYLGKIAGGKFFASRECDNHQQEQVLRFLADPADAAKVYGQETGVCCVCNATLKSEWRLRGIGPICAEKFGW